MPGTPIPPAVLTLSMAPPQPPATSPALPPPSCQPQICSSFRHLLFFSLELTFD